MGGWAERPIFEYPGSHGLRLKIPHDIYITGDSIRMQIEISERRDRLTQLPWENFLIIKIAAFEVGTRKQVHYINCLLSSHFQTVQPILPLKIKKKA